MHEVEEEIKITPNNLYRDALNFERNRLWKLTGYLDKRTQLREMREWNL